MIDAVQRAASFRGFSRGEIGVRITDDPTIHVFNRTHLGHDYATDVISFAYSAQGDHLTGELVASADTAASMSSDGWSAEAELLLYLVHGTLHIAGMDDHDPADRAAMREAEKAIMTSIGFAHIERFGADQALHLDAPEAEETSDCERVNDDRANDNQPDNAAGNEQGPRQ